MAKSAFICCISGISTKGRGKTEKRLESSFFDLLTEGVLFVKMILQMEDCLLGNREGRWFHFWRFAAMLGSVASCRNKTVKLNVTL